MIGYDLDDTLAKVDWAAASTRGLANIYAGAKVLYTPTQDFIVITARVHSSAEQRNATLNWLKDNQPHFKGLHYVSGTEAEVVKGKARLIRQYNLTSYTDNNRDILAKLKTELGSDVQLYFMHQDGSKTRA